MAQSLKGCAKPVLRCCGVFVRRGERWVDPRFRLLHGPQWETLRSQVCRALGRSESPEPELRALAQQLDAAYQWTAANFRTNAAVRVEQVDGRETIEDPPSLRML
jgi:hypothetical protein